jgi:hypothetical protein
MHMLKDFATCILLPQNCLDISLCDDIGSSGRRVHFLKGHPRAGARRFESENTSEEGENGREHCGPPGLYLHYPQHAHIQPGKIVEWKVESRHKL